jgi:hypothetical protein
LGKHASGVRWKRSELWEKKEKKKKKKSKQKKKISQHLGLQSRRGGKQMHADKPKSITIIIADQLARFHEPEEHDLDPAGDELEVRERELVERAALNLSLRKTRGAHVLVVLGRLLVAAKANGRDHQHGRRRLRGSGEGAWRGSQKKKLIN